MHNEFEDIINEMSCDRIIKNHGITNNKIGNDNKLTKNEKSKLIHDLIKKAFYKLDENNMHDSGVTNVITNQNINQVCYVIDRFEGDYAVCENRETKEMLNIELSKLPGELVEGDVLIYKDNVYRKDENKKKEIEERINEKVKNIFED